MNWALLQKERMILHSIDRNQDTQKYLGATNSRKGPREALKT